MRSSSLGAARRYARALLDVALGGADPEAVHGELDEAVRLLGDSRDLARFLTHPAVSVEKKKKVVAAVWAEGFVFGPPPGTRSTSSSCPTT